MFVELLISTIFDLCIKSVVVGGLASHLIILYVIKFDKLEQLTTVTYRSSLPYTL